MKPQFIKEECLAELEGPIAGLLDASFDHHMKHFIEDKHGEGIVGLYILNLIERGVIGHAESKPDNPELVSKAVASFKQDLEWVIEDYQRVLTDAAINTPAKGNA